MPYLMGSTGNTSMHSVYLRSFDRQVVLQQRSKAEWKLKLPPPKKKKKNHIYFLLCRQQWDFGNHLELELLFESHWCDINLGENSDVFRYIFHPSCKYSPLEAALTEPRAG